jgi:hypothetical protein
LGFRFWVTLGTLGTGLGLVFFVFASLDSGLGTDLGTGLPLGTGFAFCVFAFCVFACFLGATLLLVGIGLGLTEGPRNGI